VISRPPTMPSVRVRRSTVNSTSEDRSLAAIFAAGQQSDEVPPLPPAPPFLQNSVRGSKIHSHIAGTRGRANSVARTSVASGGAPPRTTSPDSNGRPTTPLSHHSGAQTDVVVRARSDGEPGLIGSALSLPHSDHANDLDQHGDDIVEHLDVIGVLQPSTLITEVIYLACLDPQVGTVSTLTNAANALLLYVQSIGFQGHHQLFAVLRLGTPANRSLHCPRLRR
jgi:hypothetical protein